MVRVKQFRDIYETSKTMSIGKYFMGAQEAVALDCCLCDLLSKWKEWQITEGQKNGA